MATNLSGAYNKLAGILAIKLAKNLPVLLNTEQQVSKEVFESGKAANGLTMNYVLPDYGQVLEGPTIDEGKMSYTAGVVPVTLRQFNIPFSAGSYTMTNGGVSPTWPTYQEDPNAIGGSAMTRNQLLDFEKQVKFPYGANFASKMQKRTIKAGVCGAGTTVLMDATRLQTETLWDAFAEAASAIRNARSDDEIYGVISPRMAAKAARGAANYFHPDETISKLWTDCSIGKFSTAHWFETADMEVFTTPAAAGGVGLMVGDTAPTIDAAMNEGDSELTIAAPLAVAYPAGTPFIIKDANNLVIGQVDPLGSETGVDFTFVLAEDYDPNDVTITPDPLKLKIQPVYTTGALKNVTALPDTTCTIEALLNHSTAYARGLVWAKPGLATAWGQMDALDGANNFSFNEKGLLFYGASMADIVHRRNIWRLDCLKGEVVTMSNWVASILVEL